MIKKSWLVIILLSVSSICSAQAKWQLIRNDDGIKIYTRRLLTEKLKEVRAVFDLKATTGQLVGVLQDIAHHKDWSYGTKRTYIINNRKKDTIIYYSEVSLPWPFSNRDLVIELTFNRDTVNNMLHIEAKSIPGYVAVQPGLVRVPYSLAVWNINILPNKTLRVEYILRADPGGAIPIWLVNMGCTTGPYNSFRKLRQVIASQEPN